MAECHYYIFEWLYVKYYAQAGGYVQAYTCACVHTYMYSHLLT